MEKVLYCFFGRLGRLKLSKQFLQNGSQKITAKNPNNLQLKTYNANRKGTFTSPRLESYRILGAISAEKLLLC